MLRMIRSDIYKIRKSKSFWVCLLITAAILMMNIFVTDFSHKSMLKAYEKGDSGITIELSDDNPAQESSDGDTITVAKQLHAKDYLLLAFNGDAPLMLLAIVIALFVGGEFNNGTIKNIASTNISRGKIYASKTIVSVLTAFLFVLVAGAASTITATVLWGFGSVTSGFLLTTLGKIAIELFLLAAYASIFVMSSILIRQNGGSLAINICFLEFFSMLVMLAQYALAQFAHVNVKLTNYTLNYNITQVVKNLHQGTVVRALLVGAGFFLVSYLVGAFSFKARDIK